MESIFQELFKLFDKYGENFNIYCYANDINKIACELNNNQKLTENELKLLEKVKKILGKNNFSKLHNLKCSYENYKKTGKGVIKCRYTNGTNQVLSYDEIVKMGGKKKSSQQQSSSNMDTFKTLGKSLLSTGKQLGKEFVGQMGEELKQSGKQFGTKALGEISGSIIQKGKQILDSPSFVGVFEDLGNILDQSKKLLTSIEQVKDTIDDKFKTFENNDKDIIKFLEKVADAQTNTNKNVEKDNTKIIGLLEKISDSAKDTNVILEKLVEASKTKS